MKQLIVTTILFFVTLSASAQVLVDIRAGATVSTITEQNMRMGARAGVGVGYRFTKHWGIRSGLFYTMKGATVSDYIFDYDTENSTNLSYIDLPVEASVAFRLSENSYIDLHGGPYLACLVNSAKPETVQTEVNRIDFGAGMGIDFVFGHFVFGPEAQYGFTRLASPVNEHNITYSLTLGYRF